MRPPIISVVGRSNSGKTTLIEKLIPELKKKGYRIATIKHHTHDFEIDQPGKDTWKHYHAGSDVVMLASSFKLAIIENIPKELTLEELAEKAPTVDLIITEGYKKKKQPKIEVIRNKMPPICKMEDQLWAIVGNQEDLQEKSVISLAEQGVFCFNVKQVKELADRIENDIIGGE